MPLNNIQYETIITLNNIPLQWLTYRFDFFDVEFPQFPMSYIHFKTDNHRVYGFPFTFAAKNINENICDVDVRLLLNVDVEESEELKEKVKEELENRIGSADSIDENTIIACCNGDEAYENFFSHLWEYVEEVYGEKVPFGRFFEEIDSMVRFVSAWQPKTGRQSEMRMRYNFFTSFGEKIEVEAPYGFFSFFLLPLYDDLLENDFEDFLKFQNLNEAISKIWDYYYNNHQTVQGIEVRAMAHAWPQNKEGFIDEVTAPLLDDGIINEVDKFNLERLVDAFNRHSWRAAFYIWAVKTAGISDFREWDKDMFVEFYLNQNGVGISEKVVACFLQQGFGNADVIPIDTWIQSFYEYALGIDNKREFFDSFTNMGKLERVIWLASQANKINLKSFFNTMWCTRFGNRGNRNLRGANPISCYECELRGKCVGYNKIADLNVKIVNEDLMDDPRDVFRQAREEDCEFICATSNSVPKKVYKKFVNRFQLVDEFSGYLLSDQQTDLVGEISTVSELVESLPEFELD